MQTPQFYLDNALVSIVTVLSVTQNAPTKSRWLIVYCELLLGNGDGFRPKVARFVLWPMPAFEPLSRMLIGKFYYANTIGH